MVQSLRKPRRMTLVKRNTYRPHLSLDLPAGVALSRSQAARLDSFLSSDGALSSAQSIARDSLLSSGQGGGQRVGEGAQRPPRRRLPPLRLECTTYLRVSPGAASSPNAPDYSCLVEKNEPDGPCHRITVHDFGSGVLEASCIPQSEPFFFSGARRSPVRRRLRSELSPEDAKSSYYRSRRALRHKALILKADRLLTLTTRAVISDVVLFRSYGAEFLRRVRRTMPDFQAVIVLEPQDRGALHAHMAIKGFRNVNVLRHHWRAVVGDGNVDITSPRRGGHAWRATHLAGYLAKYLGKGFAASPLTSVKRWSASLGIGVPIKTSYFISRGDITFLIFRQLIERLSGSSSVRVSSFHDPTLYGLFARSY